MNTDDELDATSDGGDDDGKIDTEPKRAVSSDSPRAMAFKAMMATGSLGGYDVLPRARRSSQRERYDPQRPKTQEDLDAMEAAAEKRRRREYKRGLNRIRSAAGRDPRTMRKLAFPKGEGPVLSVEELLKAMDDDRARS